MSKLEIKYKPKNNESTAKLSIKFPEIVQERILELISANVYSDFLPVSILKTKKNSSELICKVRNFLPLSSYLHNIIDCKLFLELVEKIILVIKNCENNWLNCNNIELNLDAIFIEPSNQIIKCIYWPVVNKHDYISEKDFFQNLPNHANISDVNKGFVVNQYNQFFKGILPFSLNNFEKLILELQGKKVKTTEISPSSNLLHEDGTSSSLNPVVSKDTPLSYDPVVLAASSKVVSKSNVEISRQIKLRRVANDEQVSITSAVFKIGKSEEDNNYAIVDNSAISRKHAEILFKNNNYYIVDCNSTNGVSLNNKRIKPAVEYKIKAGDRLRFANEEFEVV